MLLFVRMMIILPQPNVPKMAHVLPSTGGNRASKTYGSVSMGISVARLIGPRYILDLNAS
jgi:hypothetical protein